MEKRPPSVKCSFLKLLPKAASPVIFLSPPLSPVGDRRIENTVKLKIVSMVPPEARRKTKNGSFDTREPTSPKVSCMGHVLNNNNNNKTKLVLPPPEKPKSKKNPFSIHKIFKGSNHCRKSGGIDDKKPVPDSAPCLNQMKRFASGRDAFMNFDWKVLDAAVAPDGQNHFSDGGKGERQEKEIIPFSGGIEPKKAIDLWKRRAVAPPPILRLKKK